MLTLRMLSLTLRMLSRTTAPMVPIETAIDLLTLSSDISSIHCHCSSNMKMSAMKKPIALLTGLLKDPFFKGEQGAWHRPPGRAGGSGGPTALLKLPTDSYGELEGHSDSELLKDTFFKGERGAWHRPPGRAGGRGGPTALLKLLTDSYGELEDHSELLTDPFSKGSGGPGAARQ